MQTSNDNRRRRNPGHAIGQKPMDVADLAELNTRVIIRPDVPPSKEFLPERANELKLTTLKKVGERYGIAPRQLRGWMSRYEGAPEVKGYLVNGTGIRPYLYSAQDLVLFVEKVLNTQFAERMRRN